MNDTVHIAIPVPPAVSREHYQEVRTHRAIVERARRQRGNLGYAVGIVGLAAAGCMGLAVSALFPLKTVEPYVLEVNHADESVGPVHVLADAPKMFDEVMVRGQVFEYIMAREAYDPHKDEVNWTRVRNMSAANVWTPYEAWVNTRDAPKHRLGMTGAINVDEKTVWLSDPLKSDTGTISYKMRFEKNELTNGTAAEKQVCNGEISLRFNPELLVPGRYNVFLNSMGMQVLSYAADDCHFVGSK